MAKELLLERDGKGGLRPADPMSAELIDGLPMGATFGATIRQKRNLAHHRKYWALIRAIYEHQGLYPTEEALSDGIKKGVGLVKEVLNPETMEVEYDAASIAFDAMDQEAFEAFFDRAVDLICRRIVPGLAHADLEREVNEILAGKRSIAA